MHEEEHDNIISNMILWQINSLKPRLNYVESLYEVYKKTKDKNLYIFMINFSYGWIAVELTQIKLILSNIKEMTSNLDYWNQRIYSFEVELEDLYIRLDKMRSFPPDLMKPIYA